MRWRGMLRPWQWRLRRSALGAGVIELEVRIHEPAPIAVRRVLDTQARPLAFRSLRDWIRHERALAYEQIREAEITRGPARASAGT